MKPQIDVFLADDHAVVCDGLRLVVQEQPDMNVVGVASNGRDAVKRVQSLRPDVTVMDIAMPLLDGIEATRQIRETCRKCQVVVLSMHATTEHIYQALRAGALGYLLKESAGKEVIEAIRTVRGGERYLSRKIRDTVFDDFVHRRDAVPDKSPLEKLSSREREVLQLVVSGFSSKEIGHVLALSPKTIATYRCRLMQKLEVCDVPSLVRFAIEHGITPEG